MASHDGYCPNCGAEVPTEAIACPECGSCEETGWSGKAKYDQIGVDYDDAFDYESFVQEEFGDGNGKSRAKSPMRWVWTIVAILLIALFIKHYLRLF